MQLYLHSGVPGYYDAYADYILDFGANMTGALQSQTQGRERRGVFAAACYSHTSFDSSWPLISNASFLEAFADFLFDRGEMSNWLLDDCCSGSEVVFNPTCETSSPAAKESSYNVLVFGDSWGGELSYHYIPRHPLTLSLSLSYPLTLSPAIPLTL